MSLKERINLVKQQLGMSEVDTLNIEKALGKKLVDYESIDALVAALMGYYNPLIQGIDEKFKNFCPFKVGDIYLTTNSTNPSSLFLGTTWQKIEGRFLLGTSGSSASKQTGGSNTKLITKSNLPNEKLQVDNFSLTNSEHEHYTIKLGTAQSLIESYPNHPISSVGLTGTAEWNYKLGTFKTDADPDSSHTSKTTIVLGSASPQTSALGSGQALDITPSYYTVHMWLRIS